MFRAFSDNIIGNASNTNLSLSHTHTHAHTHTHTYSIECRKNSFVYFLSFVCTWLHVIKNSLTVKNPPFFLPLKNDETIKLLLTSKISRKAFNCKKKKIAISSGKY